MIVGPSHDDHANGESKSSKKGKEDWNVSFLDLNLGRLKIVYRLTDCVNTDHSHHHTNIVKKLGLFIVNAVESNRHEEGAE